MCIIFCEIYIECMQLTLSITLSLKRERESEKKYVQTMWRIKRILKRSIASTVKKKRLGKKFYFLLNTSTTYRWQLFCSMVKLFSISSHPFSTSTNRILASIFISMSTYQRITVQFIIGFERLNVFIWMNVDSFHESFLFQTKYCNSNQGPPKKYTTILVSV